MTNIQATVYSDKTGNEKKTEAFNVPPVSQGCGTLL